MVTTTPDLHDALVQAGVHKDAAARIARGIERRILLPPWSVSILIATIIGGFGMLTVGIDWVRSDVQDVRAEVAANRDRIDALNERFSSMSERISSLEVGMSGRLTRIETLLEKVEERLPERR